MENVVDYGKTALRIAGTTEYIYKMQNSGNFENVYFQAFV